jgi:hypothetical protein
MSHPNYVARPTPSIEHTHDRSEHAFMNNGINLDVDIFTDMIGSKTQICSLHDLLDHGRTCEAYIPLLTTSFQGMYAHYAVIVAMVELMRHSLINNTVHHMNIWHMIIATMVEIVRHPLANYIVPSRACQLHHKHLPLRQGCSSHIP